MSDKRTGSLNPTEDSQNWVIEENGSVAVKAQITQTNGGETRDLTAQLQAQMELIEDLQNRTKFMIGEVAQAMGQKRSGTS